ncbi:MAG TPA: hypothetical protein VK801_05395 [Caulobacteraceae bacterium]|jgi:hypothetical protein|nr:hypothetical protein [Caulobacteraceae bacterium]
MPIMQTLLGELNNVFRQSRINELAGRAEDFAPGKPLHAALTTQGSPLHGHAVNVLQGMPGSIHEVIRSTIYYALKTQPPTLVSFAWAPGYDYEVTVWQAPDTAQTRGGITVLVKSRYPSDAHPLAAGR